MESIIEQLSNWISLSSIVLFVIPILLYLVNPSTIHIKGFIGLVITPLITEFLKKNVTKTDSPRPQGAKNCNLFCNDGDQSGKPGMPSGHSATSVFFTAYYFQYTQNIYLRVAMIIYTALIMLSRYLKRCHTINQIVGGGLLGLIIAGILVRHL